jgi:adenine-specific DNA-methyltransferase
LRGLKGSLPAFALQTVAARVRGYESDAFAAWLGQVFLEAATLPLIIEAGRRPADMIDVCDSLNREVKAPPRFDLVVGNPPFGRQKLPGSQRTRFARSLYGHANMYGVFMDLAVQHTRESGFVAFLTPPSFLAGEYFKNLRALLWREAPPVAVDLVTARKGVFEDVLQETVIATYRKGAARRRARVYLIHAGIGRRVVPEPAGRLTLPRKATAPWLLPRHLDDAALVPRMRSMSARIADWGYEVSTGPLVWNRVKDQLGDKAGQGRIPLIWAESVASDGRFLFRSERRNHKPYFQLREGDEWLVVRQPCVLLQRTTAKEQARRLIAAEMPAGFLRQHGCVTVENHLNMLVPATSKPAVSPGLLAMFLNSAAADRAFRCLSGSVAVSAYEIENLPLPDASQLKRLVGRRCNPGMVEAAAAKLYGAKDIYFRLRAIALRPPIPESISHPAAGTGTGVKG